MRGMARGLIVTSIVGKFAADLYLLCDSVRLPPATPSDHFHEIFFVAAASTGPELTHDSASDTTTATELSFFNIDYPLLEL